MKKLTWIFVLVFNLYAIDSLSQTMTNFRIEDNQKSRVYFNAKRDISGLTKEGFVISGKTISSVTIDGNGLGGYFTVNSPFTWWDNSTIKLGEFEDSKDRQSVLHNFTLEYIINKISEPTTTSDVYVTDNARVGGNGSVGSPYTLQEAVSNAKAGQTIWVKNGTYSTSTINIASKDGTPSNPIKLIGYKTLDGNNRGVPYSKKMIDDFNYISHDQAITQFDSSMYPVRNGKNTDDTEGLLFAGGSSYWIVKNIQITKFTEGIQMYAGTSFIHIENCMIGDIWTSVNEKGKGVVSNTDSNNIRLLESISFDSAINNVGISGRSFLVKDNVVFGGEGAHNSTDYYITSAAAINSVWINNHIEKVGSPNHNGHGLILKAHADSYNNLMFGNTTIRIGETNAIAYRDAHHNVVKNNRVKGERGNAKVHSRLLRARHGAHHNVFENNYGEDLTNGFLIGTPNNENSPVSGESAAHNNIIRNNIVVRAREGVLYGNKANAKLTLRNNKIYNNTFVDCDDVFRDNSDNSMTYSGNEFKNNIIQNSDRLVSDGNASDWIIEYNDWDSCNFKNPTGSGNISVDPKFKNKNNGDYRLEIGSPLKDYNNKLSEVKTDYDGGSRSNGTYGAFEYQDNSTGSVNANAGSDETICQGDSVTLTASGGSSYSWSTGATTKSITVNPNTTTTYTVTVTEGSASDNDSVLVTVNSVTANAGTDVSIDEGGSVTLTANGGDSYEWSNGATTKSITVSPNSTKTFTVTATKNGCEDADSVEVRVNSSTGSVNANAGSDETICQGDSVTLTASGGSSYSWSNGSTTKSITVTPNATTTYTVTVTEGGSSDTDSVLVTVNNVTANAGTDVSIDEGDSVTLTANGGDSYEWSNGATTKSITVSPNSTKTFTVTATKNGCEDTDSVEVRVNSSTGSVNANAGSDETICQGDSVTLTASGGSSYSWSNGSTTKSITVTPNATTTYTVTVTEGGSSDTDSVLVTVNNVTANAGTDVSIDEGDSVTLTANGGDSYEWSNGATTKSITVSPNSTKTFTVTATKNGCEDTDSVEVRVNSSTGSVNANAGSDETICQGDSVTLTASGGSSYSWSNGSTTKSITVTPNATTTYTVTVTEGGSSDTDSVLVTVNNVTANAGTDVSIDEGDSVTLTANGGDSYEWSNGATTKSITVSPNSTKTFTVTATKNGCEDTDSVEVRVNSSTGSVNANAGSDETICQGDSVTLTASGGSSYSWSNGSTTKSITVTPNATTTYTVTVTEGGSSDTDSVLVTVNNVTANAGTDVSIDEGDSVTLTAGGGDSYVWSTGATTRSITVSPTETQFYDVTVTKNGCADDDSVKVTVNSSTGSVTANAGADVSICRGESITLTASGGSNYRWNTGATTKSITVSPSQTRTYNVTVSEGNNSDADEVIVTVNSVTANAGNDVSIDEGDSVTLTANGGDSYEWSNGATTKSITVSPNSTKTYTVTATKNGCEDTGSVQVTVNPVTVSVTANAGADVSICSGESTTLTAAGGSSYSWSTGATTKSITVNPNTTTTYTVTVTEGSASDTDAVMVTVNETPVANAGDNKTIDIGQNTTLKASGGDSYLWSTGATTKKITVSPIETKIYTVTAYKNGCEDTDSVQITVNQNLVTNPKPAIADAGEDQTICAGDIVTLNASGGETYLWSTGDVGESINVSPSRTTTYTLRASSGGNTTTDTVLVIVESCSTRNEENKLNEFNVYPNPTTGTLNVTANSDYDSLNLNIYSMTGSVVYSDKVQTNNNIAYKSLNISNLNKGIYIVRLYNSDYDETKKILLF